MAKALRRPALFGPPFPPVYEDMMRAFFISALTLTIFLLLSHETLAIELRLGHYGSDTHPSHQAARQFAKNVNKRTGNEITVTIFPQDTLGSPKDILDMVVEGSLDMCLAGQNYLSHHAKMFDVVTIPFSLKDYAHADRVLDSPEFREWAAEELDALGLVYISRWEWGFRQITNSVRPITKPEDMAGLVFRTPPSPASKAAIETFGGVVVPVSFEKLVPTLREGTVDGQENPLCIIYNLRLYESQKYICLLNFLYTSMSHVVGKGTWGRLTPFQKRVIQEESEKAGLAMRKTIRSGEARQLSEMRARGAVVTFPDEEAFKKRIDPAREAIKRDVGEANYARWMRLVEAAR